MAVPSPAAGIDAVTEDLSLADGAHAVAAGSVCGTYVLQITDNSLAVQQQWKRLPQFQIGYKALERRLIFHRAWRQGRETDVRWNPAHVEVAGHDHLFPLGLHLGHFLLVVHHQPGLSEVAREEDSVPPLVVDACLRVQGGWFGTVDGEAHLEPPVCNEELQEVAVPSVIQIEHQGFAGVAFQNKAELTCRLGIPLAVACPLTRNPFILQS